MFENDKQLLDPTIIFTLVHESAGVLEIETFVSTKDIGATTLLHCFAPPHHLEEVQPYDALRY